MSVTQIIKIKLGLTNNKDKDPISVHDKEKLRARETNKKKKNQISVQEEYSSTRKKHFHQAIISSLFRKPGLQFSSLITKIQKYFSYNVFMCEICVEPKPQKKSFNIVGCTHFYCSECIVKYVALKIQENVISISCPETNCQGVIEPEYCHSILPPRVFDRWCIALCESLIPLSQRFYCPFKDCSALLVNDGKVVVKYAECPHCARFFCAQCNVPWHSEMTCEEVQELNENERGAEDIMLMNLAKQEKWRRCPHCKFYVQRYSGCSSMVCRCKLSFCYLCGAPTDLHHDPHHRCVAA